MNVAEKIDIRQLSDEKIAQWLTEHGEKPFRAKQIHQWIWQKHALSFEEMSNLSKPLRATLEDNFTIQPVEVFKSQKSADGTIKFIFRLADDNFIEGVLIPAGNRMTACVSSQVGCSLSCTFCATGFLKRQRNLQYAEIVDQVVLIDEQAQKHFDKPLSNIVFMGMGEPLLNYKNVMTAIDIIHSDKGLGMSYRRITLSTAGISKMIDQMATEKVKFNLALSLHASNNQKRSEIMPINDSNPLEKLAESLQNFYDQTGTRVTLEYCVINEVNDFKTDADELIAFAQQFPCKVNLIEYNAIELADFKASSVKRLEQFAKWIDQAGVIVNIRRSRGKDIDAACGQLANKLE